MDTVERRKDFLELQEDYLRRFKDRIGGNLVSEGARKLCLSWSPCWYCMTWMLSMRHRWWILRVIRSAVVDGLRVYCICLFLWLSKNFASLLISSRLCGFLLSFLSLHSFVPIISLVIQNHLYIHSCTGAYVLSSCSWRHRLKQCLRILQRMFPLRQLRWQKLFRVVQLEQQQHSQPFLTMP